MFIEKTPTTDARQTIAHMNFLSEDAEHPAVVYPTDGTPPAFVGGYVWQDVAVHDGRFDEDANGEDAYGIDKTGFERVDLAPLGIDFEDEADITTRHYRQVADTIKRSTGGAEVLIFDHTIRRTHALNGRFPASHVHVDYTEDSAIPRLLRSRPELAERIQGKRVQQINLWRSINGVVRRSPLAFADASRLRPADLVRTEIRYLDKETRGVIYGLRNKPWHRWTYFSEMSEEEAVLIKSYDSDRSLAARFTPHSAFEHPETAANAPERASIETRSFVIHD